MAKRKRRVKRSCIQRMIRFFLPSFGFSAKQWIWFGLSRIGLAFTSIYFTLSLIFSILPVPFSAYMVQKKVSHFLQGDDYQIHYDWVSLDRIAWQMQMAVIASEDQKFDSHFGLDFNAIEQALKRNSKSKKKAIGA